MVLGSSGQDSFPDITFKTFSDFILCHFNDQISLATVLTILFSVTNNPDLLNLHARQQNPKVIGEVAQKRTGWMKTLSQTLEDKLGDMAKSLFQDAEYGQLSKDQITNSISTKLDSLVKILDIYPFDERGHQVSKIRPISEKDVEPVQVICPASMECETKTCHSHALHQHTRERDISKVTLIKGTKIFTNVPVLAGYCPQCNTTYYADHERSQATDGRWMRVYLNSAKYMKVGQQVWVDRIFSGAVLNGMYSFHASTAAYMEFWNSSFWESQESSARKISRRHIWQSFVQESVQKVAAASGLDVEIADRLPIDEVTKKAFEILGEQGLIRSADGHSCSECTHNYIATSRCNCCCRSCCCCWH
jgi:CxC5 like cysteine cluster associated with KDZ transposases